MRHAALFGKDKYVTVFTRKLFSGTMNDLLTLEDMNDLCTSLRLLPVGAPDLVRRLEKTVQKCLEDEETTISKFQ